MARRNFREYLIKKLGGIPKDHVFIPTLQIEAPELATIRAEHFVPGETFNYYGSEIVMKFAKMELRKALIDGIDEYIDYSVSESFKECGKIYRAEVRVSRKKAVCNG